MGELKATQEQIDVLMESSTFYDIKMGEKTCVVTMRLPNGFEITETAACLDPASYSHEVGFVICKRRIAERLWEFEGYRLQCAAAG